MRLLGQVELFIIVRSSEQQMIFIQSVQRVGVCVCVCFITVILFVIQRRKCETWEQSSKNFMTSVYYHVSIEFIPSLWHL